MTPKELEELKERIKKEIVKLTHEFCSRFGKSEDDCTGCPYDKFFIGCHFQSQLEVINQNFKHLVDKFGLDNIMNEIKEINGQFEQFRENKKERAR